MNVWSDERRPLRGGRIINECESRGGFNVIREERRTESNVHHLRLQLIKSGTAVLRLLVTLVTTGWLMVLQLESGSNTFPSTSVEVDGFSSECPEGRGLSGWARLWIRHRLGSPLKTESIDKLASLIINFCALLVNTLGWS